MTTIRNLKYIFIDMAPEGSLQVFALVTKEEADNHDTFNKVYWHDATTETPYGPFYGCYEAVEHYKHTQRLTRSVGNNAPASGLENRPTTAGQKPLVTIKNNITSIQEWKDSKKSGRRLKT